MPNPFLGFLGGADGGAERLRRGVADGRAEGGGTANEPAGYCGVAGEREAVAGVRRHGMQRLRGPGGEASEGKDDGCSSVAAPGQQRRGANGVRQEGGGSARSGDSGEVWPSGVVDD